MGCFRGTKCTQDPTNIQTSDDSVPRYVQELQVIFDTRKDTFANLGPRCGGVRYPDGPSPFEWQDCSLGKISESHPLKLTASSHLKIGRNPKGNEKVFQIFHFWGAKMLVSGRVKHLDLGVGGNKKWFLSHKSHIIQIFCSLDLYSKKCWWLGINISCVKNTGSWRDGKKIQQVQVASVQDGHGFQYHPCSCIRLGQKQSTS